MAACRAAATVLLGTADGRVLPLARPARPLFGDYEVVTLVARGGMGGVYLATHVPTGERVALKVLDPAYADHAEVVARLYAEQAVATRAHHPGLVEIRGSARAADGTPYLVMEYLDGATLAAQLDGGALPIDVVVTIGAQVASALAALHESGVIHCDVKPENILLAPDRASGAKVIDFGVSRGIDEPPCDADGSIAGTPPYMAPEQWRGAPEPASDVYSLGCVLFELATGEAPFTGSMPMLMVAHVEQRPSRPSWLRAGVPIELERLILRALSKEPALRPAMYELARDLAALASAYALRTDARLAG
jgi:serine/threonine-protein kinase